MPELETPCFDVVRSVRRRTECPDHAPPPPFPVHVSRPVCLVLALWLVTASCGGDGGPSGTTGPDNTVTAISISPSAPLTLASGTTTTLTASATARDGPVITNAPITWTSSDPSVVVMSGPQLTAIKVGTATITAASGSANKSVSVTVVPGAVQRFTILTQPTGAPLGELLATQPVVEAQDAAGNLVTSSTAFVTAAIASGGGTLGGTVSLPSVGGVAAFTNLRISGSVGPHTLRFIAGSLSAISAPFTITSPPTPFINVDSTAISVSVQRGSNPAPRTINITNIGSQPLVGMSVDVAYDAGQVSGWLSPSLSTPDAPAALTLSLNTAGVVEGTYHATVHVNAPGASNSPVSVGVTLTVKPNYSVGYGTSAEKVRIVDVGATFAPTIAIVDAGGNPVPDISLTFTSRASTVATVGADGRITAVGGGDAWIVASTPATSDSVFVIVPRSPTAPVIRSDATTFTARLGDTLFVNVIFDTR